MSKLNLTAIEEKEKMLKLRKLELLKAQVEHEHKNAINYFGNPDKELAQRHFNAGCCKLGKGSNPMQAKLLTSWADRSKKVFTFTGGNRIGKTTIGAVIAFSVMFGKWPWSGEGIKLGHNSPRKVRYIGQDWEKHIKAVVEPALKKWWPDDRRVTTKKNNQGIESVWVDESTKSVLEIMSNNQESDLHEGWEGDLVIYDEPPKRDIRIANARGLVDRNGRELFCMTLLKEAWVDREVIRAVNADGSPDMSVFNISGEIYDNIGYGLTQEGVDQFAKMLTDEEKDARLRGVPSYLSGLVYPQFDRHTHIKQRFPIPHDWIIEIAIDIHPRERQAALFIATDPRNYRYVCFEIWEHGDGTYIAEQICRIIKRNDLRVETILIDPLSKADSNVDKEEVSDMLEGTTYSKVEKVLSAHGLPLDTAIKAKTSGILEVRNHLKGPNNMPSMFFFNDLARTIWEIEGYMYDEETQKPIDKDDHMCENLYRLLLKNTQWYPAKDKHKQSKPVNWRVA